MTLSAALLQLAAQMAPTVQSWPRRQPGLLMVDGKVLRYADLHSVYHQIRQIFGDHLYDFQSRRPDPRILDCGAHIGLSSLYFKQRYPGARITAFEADAALADMCRSNMGTLGAADVEVIQAAVWTHDRGVSFDGTHDDSGHVAAGGGTTVPSVRLKTILDKGSVDLLKLDVEGAEYDIIADCGDSLAAVDRLAMEVHAMDETPVKIGGLLDGLEKQGFRYVLGDLHQASWLPALATPFTYCRTAKFIVSVFAWR